MTAIGRRAKPQTSAVGESVRSYVRSSQATEDVLVFGAVVLTHAVLAYALAFVWEIWQVETLARTASAQAVFWSRDPHLTAIGFALNPLQTVLQLPLVLVRPLASIGIAGPIVSLIAGGVGAVFLLRAVRSLGVSRPLSYLFLAAAAAMPLMLFSATNGAADAAFVAATWAATYYFIRAERERENVQPLALLGVAIGAAFLARPEGIVLVALGLLAVMVGEYSRRSSQPKVEGLAVAYLVMPVYVVTLWVLANWLVSGDPLAFVAGQTPRSFEAEFLPAEVRSLVGRPLDALRYVGETLWAVSPLFFVAGAPVLLWALVRRSLVAVFVLAIWASVPLLQVVLLTAGLSFGATRSFIFAIPGGIAAAAIAFGWASRSPGVVASVVRVVVVLAVALSPIAAWVLLPELADERPYLDALAGRPVSESPGFARRDSALIAAIDALDGPILVDTATHPALVLGVAQPSKLVVPSDRDFGAILANHSARYLLVPRPRGTGLLDAVNAQYPRLYGGGESWAVFERDFPVSGLRLYRIRTADAAGAPRP